MSSELPAPLVPADVDLTDFEYMPLEVRRFRDSAIVSTRSPEGVLAAILLWSASWHQIPASSLPSRDEELAPLAGYGRGVRDFRRVKDDATHKLILCSDRRYYHPVVAEKAAPAWNSKLEEAWKRATDRVRKENKEREHRKLELLQMPARGPRLALFDFAGIPRWLYADSAGNAIDSAGIPDDGRRNSRLKRSEVKGREVENRGSGVYQSSVASGPVDNPAHPAIEDPEKRKPNGKGDGAGQRWDDPRYVVATGETLGIRRRAGEGDDDFRDRVYSAVRRRRVEAASGSA